MLIAKFPDGISEITVNGLHQWDYGQQLQIEASDLPALFEVHFAHPDKKEAIVRSCAAVNGVGTVVIPDVCLEHSRTIQGWIYEIDGAAGKTTKTFRLNVIKRVRPAIYGDVPLEISDKYTEAVAAMNGAVVALQNGDTIVKEANHSAEADNASTAEIANTARSVRVNTLQDIKDLLLNFQMQSFGISIGESAIRVDTQNGGVGIIPAWAIGTVVTTWTGIRLCLMDTYKNTVTVYGTYNAGNDEWTWLVCEMPEKAKYASVVNLSNTEKTADHIITSPGLYCVTVQAASGSGILTTHLLSVENRGTTVRSMADVNNVYVTCNGETGSLTVNGGDGGNIVSFIRVIRYDF